MSTGIRAHGINAFGGFRFPAVAGAGTRAGGGECGGHPEDRKQGRRNRKERPEGRVHGGPIREGSLTLSPARMPDSGCQSRSVEFFFIRFTSVAIRFQRFFSTALAFIVARSA
jgi:hypothetical protein